MGKFHPFLTVICLQYIHIYFQDNNLSKSQWIFTKFDMCIDIVEMLWDCSLAKFADDMVMAGYYHFIFVCVFSLFKIHVHLKSFMKNGKQIYSLRVWQKE